MHLARPRPAASQEEPCSTPPPLAPHRRCLLPGSGWPAWAWGYWPDCLPAAPSRSFPAHRPDDRKSRRRRPPLPSRPCWRGASVMPPNFPPIVLLGIFAVPLARIDIVHHLLPNRLLDPCWAAGSALLAVAALVAGAAGDLLRGAAGSVILFVFYLILALTSKNGLGMGDVKLAAPLGLYLGYLGWSQLFYGGALGFVAGGLASVVPGAEKPRKQATGSRLRPLHAGSRTCRHPASSLTPATPVTSMLISKRAYQNK